MNIVIDQERLAKITTLASGSHEPNDTDMCVMEAVAFVTHKEWSDHPPCVCPVIGAFVRTWNDGLSDAERTDILLPFVPRLLNTKRDEATERARAMMAADWLIRTHAVAWLRLARLNEQADFLAALPEITDFAQCPSLMTNLPAIRRDAAAAGAAARDAAGAAAWAAARDAARAAAWDAARAAAWDAARAAAGDAAWAAAWDVAWDAARAAAWDAAWDAARDAAGAAAGDAAWDALKSTQVELQKSAVELVDRMIAL
jgi:hypothetical protein